MRTLLLILTSVILSFANVTFIEKSANDIGFIDEVTINGREFDSLPKSIEFYPEDLQDGKVVIGGILESESEKVPVKNLQVEISIDGGKSWNRVKGNSEWEWSFKPLVGKTYKLSLRVVRLFKKNIPKTIRGKITYIASIKPDRLKKNTVQTLLIKGENFTKNMLLSLESQKVKILSVKFIDKNRLEAKVLVPEKTDMDVSALFFRNSKKEGWRKSIAHLWFVNVPKIAKDFKLKCEQKTKSEVSKLHIKPKSIKETLYHNEDTPTSQSVHGDKVVGFIPFLDDQTKLKWDSNSNISPSYYIVTFYTVDKKKIKSIWIKSDKPYGSLTLLPNQLYQIYKEIPEKFTPENDPKKNEEKYILSFYTKNYPGARFLFWRVEAFNSIMGCKGIKIQKTAESKFGILRMGKAPTGVVCDDKNKFLSVTKVKGRGNDQTIFPGDTLELQGRFSLENSPWSPKNIVVDWGDGKFDVVDLGSYDRNKALTCEQLNTPSCTCNVENSGKNQMIKLRKKHIYQEAGRFKIRVYVLPVDELQNASQIAKSNRQNDMKSAFVDKKSKLCYYAMAGNIKSDIHKPYQISSFSSANKMIKSITSSDKIFEVYCNPLDVYIVKDPDATGPLKLTSLEITGFSSDKKDKERNRLLSAVHYASHTNVTLCEKVLFAKAKLLYHGHGYVRVSWFVDGVKMQEEEMELGPTKNRENLNYNNPSSWQKPIDETLYLLSSKLPLAKIAHHNIKVEAEVIADKTKDVSDQSVKSLYTIMNSTISSIGFKRDRLFSSGSYDVKKSKKGEICFFKFPVENGKYLQIFDIKNLKKTGDKYSGDAKVLFHIANSYGGVGEYYMPFHFENWKSDKNAIITEGKLFASSKINIMTDAGVKLLVKKLRANIGKRVQISFDITLSNNSLFEANSKSPVTWRDIDTPLSYEGDIYISGLKLPVTRIGWSLFNISSKNIIIDLSHKEGEGGCGGLKNRRWVGINLKEAKLYPYTFHLANSISFPIRGWIIDGSGVCGEFRDDSGFSHVFAKAKIGWKSLFVKAKNNTLKAKYGGFYLDMPWPKVKLKGKDVALDYTLSDKNGVEANIDLSSSETPEERYGFIDMKVLKIKNFAIINYDWGVFADVKFTFYDVSKKERIVTKVKDAFFTIYETVGFGKDNSDSVELPVKNQTINLGGSTLNIAKLLLKSYKKHGSDRKFKADFSAFITLEKWSQTSTHLLYELKRESSLRASKLKIAAFKPVRRLYPLNKPMNESTLKDLKYIQKPTGSVHYAYFKNPYAPKSDISLYPHIAGLSVNAGGGECSAMKNDTFSAHVNTSFFPGAPSVEATFRYGTLDNKAYWLVYCKLDHTHIPIFPSVFLDMIKGGVCYRFDPDDMVNGSGCNSQPDTSYGLGFALGAGVIVSDEKLLRLETTMVINPTEKKVGFYDIRGTLLKQVDIKQGKIEYVYKSHFQTTLGAIVALPPGEKIIKADATGGENGKIDLYMGNDYYLHIGTKNDPLKLKMLMFNGEGYMMAGSDIKGLEVGFHTFLGFSSLGDGIECKKSKANCASLGISERAEFNLNYDPFSFYMRNDSSFHARACIKFGKYIGTACMGAGADGYYILGCCSPVKIIAGAKLDFSPLPSVSAEVGIAPKTYLDVDIHW